MVYKFSTCTTAEELTATIRLAEIAAGCPYSCIPAITQTSQKMFSIQASDSSRLNGHPLSDHVFGSVCIHMTSPDIRHRLDIIDLPGLLSLSYQVTTQYQITLIHPIYFSRLE